MKRYTRVDSARRPSVEKPKRSSRTNVKKVCEAMGWYYPPSSTSMNSQGYKCKWGPGRNTMLDNALIYEVIKRLCDEYDIDFDLVYDGNDSSCYSEFIELLAQSLHMSPLRQFYDSPEYEEFSNAYRELERDIAVKEAARERCEDRLDKIYELTGINCQLSRGGAIVIPYDEN